MEDKKPTNLRNRPKATEYSEVQAGRGSGQLDSINAYLRDDPVSYFYYKFKETKNPYLRDDYWSEASKRGETDLLVSLLGGAQGEGFSSEAYDILAGYGDRMDYDDYMLALQMPFLDNDSKNAKDRLTEDGGYNFGKFTDQEWAWEILKHTVGRWDAELIEEWKATRNGFLRFAGNVGGQIVAAGTNVVGGALRFVGDIADLGISLMNVMSAVIQETDISSAFLQQYAGDSPNPIMSLGEWFQAASFEFQRKYLSTVSATKAYDEGYRLGEGNWLEQIDKSVGVGTGYSTWGRWMNAGSDAIGYMLPTILLGTVTGGAGTAGVMAKTATAINKSRSLIFYTGIFSGMVRDTVQTAKLNGVDYKSLNAGTVIANAAAKAAIQWGIEQVLSMVLGNTISNQLMGTGRGAAGRVGAAAAKAATDSTLKAMGRVGLELAKDALQEGLEEALQELSDVVVDWAFGGSYRKNMQENFTWQNVLDAAIVGALSSIVMGGVDNLTTKQATGVSGVDADGLPVTFKLGRFQSMNLKQAMKSMAEWYNDMNDPKSKPDKRAAAILKLDAAINTLGSLYQNMGEQRAKIADGIIQDIMAMQDKQEQITALGPHTDYVNKLWDDFTAAKASGEFIGKMKKVDVAAIREALQKQAGKLQGGLVTKIDGIITTDTDPNDPELQAAPEATRKIIAFLKKEGIVAAVSVDSDIIVKSDDVLIVSDLLLKNGDIASMVEGISYNLVLDTISPRLSNSLKKNILKTYNEVTGTDGTMENAIMALLFNPGFYTATLLRAGEGAFGPKSSPASIEILSTLDQVLKQKLAPNITSGTITERAYRALLQKVQKNMQSGLVTFATQYANIDLGKIDNTILPADIKAEITNHQNVVFTQMVNAGLANKSKVPDTQRSLDYDAAIDKYAGAKGMTPKLLSTLKDKVRSTNYNDRVDAYMTLVLFSKTTSDSLNKTTYLIPATQSGKLVVEQHTKTVEAKWGARFADIVSGNIDFYKLHPDMQAFIKTMGYDTRIFASRIAALRYTMFENSGKTLTVMNDGQIAQVIDKNDLVKSKYLGPKGQWAILNDLIQGKIKTIGDIVNTNDLAPEVKNVEIHYNPSLGSDNGSYVDGTNLIEVSGKDIVNTIMHELTHYTQQFFGDSEKGTARGGSTQLFTSMDPTERDSLIKYAQTNFPVTYALLISTNPDITALYFMLEGELQANAVSDSIMFETGFTMSPDRKTIYAPDGSNKWSTEIKANKNSTTEATKLIKEGAKRKKAAEQLKQEAKQSTETKQSAETKQSTETKQETKQSTETKVTPDSKPISNKLGPDFKKLSKSEDIHAILEKNLGTFKGKKFWIASVNLLDGVIEETHTFQQAKSQDFHHSFLFSWPQLDKINDETNAIFWIDEKGKIQGDWRVSTPKNILDKIHEQITIRSIDEVETKVNKTSKSLDIKAATAAAKATDNPMLAFDKKGKGTITQEERAITFVRDYTSKFLKSYFGDRVVDIDGEYGEMIKVEPETRDGKTVLYYSTNEKGFDAMKPGRDLSNFNTTQEIAFQSGEYVYEVLFNKELFDKLSTQENYLRFDHDLASVFWRTVADATQLSFYAADIDQSLLNTVEVKRLATPSAEVTANVEKQAKDWGSMQDALSSRAAAKRGANRPIVFKDENFLVRDRGNMYEVFRSVDYLGDISEIEDKDAVYITSQVVDKITLKPLHGEPMLTQIQRQNLYDDIHGLRDKKKFGKKTKEEVIDPATIGPDGLIDGKWKNITSKDQPFNAPAIKALSANPKYVDRMKNAFFKFSDGRFIILYRGFPIDFEMGKGGMRFNNWLTTKFGIAQWFAKDWDDNYVRGFITDITEDQIAVYDAQGRMFNNLYRVYSNTDLEVYNRLKPALMELNAKKNNPNFMLETEASYNSLVDYLRKDWNLSQARAIELINEIHQTVTIADITTSMWDTNVKRFVQTTEKGLEYSTDLLLAINKIYGKKGVYFLDINEGTRNLSESGPDSIYSNVLAIDASIELIRVTFGPDEINWSETIKAPRYTSNKDLQNSNSNLKYWIKKGKPAQINPIVRNFVEKTTEDVAKLPAVLRNKIIGDKDGKGAGTLTYFDITKYVATTKSMNDYTFKALAEHVYQNEALAKMTFKEAREIIDNLTGLAATSYVVDDEAVDMVRSYAQLLSIRKISQRRADAAGDTSKEAKDWVKATRRAERIKMKVAEEVNGQLAMIEKWDEVILDEKQVMPMMFNNYDGTLRGVRRVNNLAKTMVARQTTYRSIEQGKYLAANENAFKSYDPDNPTQADLDYNSTKSGIRWLDYMRQADITYAEDLSQNLDEITKEDKIDAIENFISDSMVKRVETMTQAERDAKYDDIMDEYYAAVEGLAELSDEALNARYLTVLQTEVDPNQREQTQTILDDLDKQPKSKKNIKDEIRNVARMVTARISKLKALYNQLSPEVQAAIDPKTYQLKTEYYTNMTDTELETLLFDLKQARNHLNSVIRRSKTNQKKVDQLEKRLDKMSKRLTKAEEQAKANATMRQKINKQFNTKVINQTFTFDSRVTANTVVNQLLSTQWEKRTQSNVKGITDNTEQNVHNGRTFFVNNKDALMSMSVSDAEVAARWFLDANLIGVSNSGTESQTFTAVKTYFLGFVLAGTKAGGQFDGLNANLKQELEKHLKDTMTAAGTALAVWNNLQGTLNPYEVMKNADMEIAGVELTDAEKDALFGAAAAGDIDAVKAAMTAIIDRVNVSKTTKKNILRKLTTIRSMSMLSSPITWLRNQISNSLLLRLNKWSSKIGNLIAPSKTVAGQLKMNQGIDKKGQITPAIQAFINEHFIDNKLFDTIISNLSKYNPSDIQARFKDATGTASQEAIFANMVVKSLYNEFYNQNMFKSKGMNNMHRFLMKMLSDNNYVREASVRYFGHILAERGYDLTKGVTDPIMNDFSKAVGQGMSDYMHSHNFLNDIETVLAEKSETALFAYKMILPFASASWNWFKAAIRYSPIGLGQSIVKLTRLEHEITKAETKWAAGKSQIAPEMTEYLIRRDLGSGVIGTTAFIFGAILAALGWVDLEDDDYGTPKLRIGNVRVDLSTIFGSSSVLAGMALIKGFQGDLGEDSFITALDMMLDPLLDGFFLTEILLMDQYNSSGWLSFGGNFLEQYLLSFIPNGVRWMSGATYGGKYKTNRFFDRAVARIPFFGSVVGLEKKTNPYTGDQGDMWDAFNRVVPFLEVRAVSTLETDTKAYGINKKELRGQYEINGEKFELSPSKVAEINKAYGQWNAADLTKFYNNQLSMSVKMPNGTYRVLTYNNMNEDQRKNAIQNIFDKNATYAKISAWLDAGNLYYASDAEYAALRKLGITKGLYRGGRGYVKK